MNISSSKRLSDNDARSGLKTLPATLNKRSTGADDAGIARYLEAKIARFGHLFSCVRQNCRGSLVLSRGGWARYSSTSDSDDPATPVVMGSSASRKSNRSPPMGWSTRRRLAHGSCGVSLLGSSERSLLSGTTNQWWQRVALIVPSEAWNEHQGRMLLCRYRYPRTWSAFYPQKLRGRALVKFRCAPSSMPVCTSGRAHTGSHRLADGWFSSCA